VAGEHLRAYEAQWWPDVDPRILEVVGIDIEKTSDGAEGDAVLFIMDTVNATAIAFAYYEESAQAPEGSAGGVSVTAAEFALFFDAVFLFEYNEGNDVPGFQPDTDDLVTGFYNLGACEWDGIVVESFNLTDNNGDTFTVWVASATTSDNVFSLQFVAAGRPVSVSGKTITPDMIKIDFEIQWFNNSLNVPSSFSTGPSPADWFPNAYVGMATYVAASAGEASYNSNGGSASTTGSATTNGNPSVTIASGADFTGFFSWETSAGVTVEGEQSVVAVHAEVLDQYSNVTVNAELVSQVILFSFHNVSRPTDVIWDPETGTSVNYNNMGSNSGVETFRPISLVLVLAVLASLFFAL